MKKQILLLLLTLFSIGLYAQTPPTGSKQLTTNTEFIYTPDTSIYKRAAATGVAALYIKMATASFVTNNFFSKPQVNTLLNNYVTLGTSQTIPGYKIFTSTSGSLFSNSVANAQILPGQLIIRYTDSGLESSLNATGLTYKKGGFNTTISANQATANRTQYLQDKAGTIALAEDLVDLNSTQAIPGLKEFTQRLLVTPTGAPTGSNINLTSPSGDIGIAITRMTTGARRWDIGIDINKNFYIKDQSRAGAPKIISIDTLGITKFNDGIRIGNVDDDSFIYKIANNTRTIIRTSRSDGTQEANMRVNAAGKFLFTRTTAFGYDLATDVNPTASIVLSGNLGVGTDGPIAKLHVVGGSFFTGVLNASAAPTMGAHLINKTYADATYVNLADAQTIPSSKTFSVPIIAATAPTLGTHLTNKTYVDALVSGKANLDGGNNFTGVQNHTGTVNSTSSFNFGPLTAPWITMGATVGRGTYPQRSGGLIIYSQVTASPTTRYQSVIASEGSQTEDTFAYLPRLTGTLARLEDLPQLVEVTTTTSSLAGNTTYVLHNVGLTTVTLPVTNPAIGTIITILGEGGSFRISQNASQYIVSGNASTTVGTAGYIQSTSNNTTISLRYVNTNKWMVSSSNSSPTIN